MNPTVQVIVFYLLAAATLVSAFIFGEHISPMRLGGIAVVIAGVIMLSQS